MSDQKHVYSIHKLKNYSISKGNYSLYLYEGNINNIITRLNKNKGYHLRINPEKPSIIFIDLDHVPTTDIFNEFLNLLCVDFEIELNENALFVDQNSFINKQHN